MKLIIHGDDFGLTRGVNQGIADACTQGLLRSTSLVAGGEAFSHAIHVAQDTSTLDVGVHLTLTDEKPLTPEGHTLGGEEFLPSRGRLTRDIAAGSLDMKAVGVEWRAQIEKVIEAGIRPSHLDSHQFVHLLPHLFPLCLQLREEYKIPFVRTLLKEPFWPSAGPKRLAQWNMLKSWVWGYVQPRIPEGLPIVPCTGFTLAGGLFTSQHLLETIIKFHRLPVLEVMLHPGSGDALTAQKYAHWDYCWERDRDLCQDIALSEKLKHMGVHITSFQEIAHD